MNRTSGKKGVNIKKNALLVVVKIGCVCVCMCENGENERKTYKEIICDKGLQRKMKKERDRFNGMGV